MPEVRPEDYVRVDALNMVFKMYDLHYKAWVKEDALAPFRIEWTGGRHSTDENTFQFGTDTFGITKCEREDCKVSDGIERAQVLMKLYDIQGVVEDRSDEMKQVMRYDGKIVWRPQFPCRPIRLHLGSKINVTRQTPHPNGGYRFRFVDKYRYEKTLSFKDGETLVVVIKRMIAEKHPLA